MLQNPGGGQSGPYFSMFLNMFQEDLLWDDPLEYPVANVLKMTVSRNLVTDPVITFETVFQQPVTPWVALIGTSITGNTINPTTGTKNFSLVLSNLDQLPDGIYGAEIIFMADATYGGVQSNYDYTSLWINLTIQNNAAASITLDKAQYNVFYNRQTASLSGEKVVLISNNTTPIDLKFQGDNFITKNNVVDSFTIEEFQISNNPNLPQQGTVLVNGGLYAPDNSKIKNVPINLTIGLNSDVFVDKSFLLFSINKATPQTAVETLYITNPENKQFVITKPDWLTLSVNNGSASGYVTVTTVSSSNLAGGNYSGNIEISYDNKNITVPVFLTVISFMAFNPGTNKFCMDIPEIVFNRMNPSGRLVRVTLEAVFNLNGIETIKNNVYAVPFVDDKATFSFGEKINNQFPRWKSDFFSLMNNFVLMKNAVVNVISEELDINYTVLNSETLSNVKLFPGSKPAGYPLLSNSLFRKKNKGSVFYNSKIVGEEIIIETVESENVDELTYGDKTVIYYEFPQYNNILHFHFENENHSPEWFSFTGDFKITNEFSHIYAKNIFKSQNEKYDFSKVKMLTLNTGFFIKEELEIIEKIVESRLAFIKIGAKIYRCFSTTQKMITDDSSEELLSRDLEFLIVE